MTALLIDTATAATPAADVRVRPRRTASHVRTASQVHPAPQGRTASPGRALSPGRSTQAGRRTRAGQDARHARVVVPVHPNGWACRLERPRPRVTITEAAIAAPDARGWELTERGWAVVVLGVLLAFAGVSALLVTQFLAITAG
ncbi:hypothetical protein [Enemella sp. A6]|uniref:hypothetical protein n=1 Tax=Enemella sp. A6 TaxID=3440152 RepID=UPI003EC03563